MNPTPWYKKYSKLDDENAARDFLDRTLMIASEYLGEPRVPLKMVHLRSNRKINPSENINDNFPPLCETVSESSGEFTIYLSLKTTNPMFHGQFAHEIGHLIDPGLSDIYIEGLNTLFADKVVNKFELNWDCWEQHYDNGKDPFYGLTYWMMKEIVFVAGWIKLNKILRYTQSDSSSGKRQIRIDEWLGTLDKKQREEVVGIIHNYWPKLQSIGHQCLATTLIPTV
jgi:hypothetical protein